MQAPEPNRIYTAADIERYHNGSMPTAEMHALERAALDDPFLSDALDGYMHTHTPAADVTVLKERLQHRTSKVIAMPYNRRRLAWAAAAVLILLAGFGWLTATFLTPMNYTSANPREAAPRLEPQAAPSAPAADTMSDATAETITDEKAAAESRSVAPAKKIPPENKEVAVANETRAEPSSRSVNSDIDRIITARDLSKISKSHADDVAVSAQARSMAAPMPEKTFNVQVVDSSGNPVPFATVTDVKRYAVTQADEQGKLSLNAPDSNLVVAIKAPGFQPQQDTLASTDSATRIVLPRREDQLSEVLVPMMGKRAAHSRVRLEAAEPRVGRNRFEVYVDEHIDQAEEDAVFESGNVTLSFEIDKKDNAIDIVVEKPLCAACDSAAVRMIRETKWRKTKKDAKAKVHIRF